MGYEDRFSEDYVEEQMVLEEPESIRAFLSDLNTSGRAEAVLEPEEVDEDVEVVATYRLGHPYRGEEFSHALIHNDEVVADVNVEAYVSGPQEHDYNFSGVIRDDAYDIFNPEWRSDTGVEDVYTGQVEASDNPPKTGKAMD